MDKVYAKHGIKSIIGGNTGNQMGGWFKKEINTIEDLKGLKMRIPGFAGEIMAAVGVSWLPSFWHWHRWNVHTYHRLIISWR
jgi:TRAP-type mannitol/chloroaromatic compound transport system substrate-binding protein